jgi:drug/metabolite transporter superfamily protein YnfA
VRILTDFGRFWYELLVGDDWKIAMSVVIALTLTALLPTQTAAPDHLVAVVGGVLVVAGFCVSLILDVRRKD